MKVAIVGMGRQGKKHKASWEKYGVIPECFSKNPREKYIKKFENLSDKEILQFHCIVIAVSPIQEQTKVIQRILSEHYIGILIIEKPICDDLELLLALSRRKNTIFFIDEIFLSLESYPIQNIGKIDIYTPHTGDFYNLLEHALGWFLSNPNFSLFSFSTQLILASESNYQIYSSSNPSVLLADFNQGIYPYPISTPFNFDNLYRQMISKISHHDWNRQIHDNYLFLRSKNYIGNK